MSVMTSMTTSTPQPKPISIVATAPSTWAQPISATAGSRAASARSARRRCNNKVASRERPRFVLYFTTLDKPMVLNATNKNTVVDLGTNPADWIGAEIGLYTEPTQYAGQPTRGVRLRVLSAGRRRHWRSRHDQGGRGGAEAECAG